MLSLLQAAFVIGRRDFVATVYTRTFLLFLLGPVLIIGISFLFGNVTEKMARQDLQVNVAVIASKAEFRQVEAARTRLNEASGERELPVLVHEEPDYVLDRQVQELLGSSAKRFVAVLTGGLAKPTLTGDVGEKGSIRRQMTLIVEEARQQSALRAAGVNMAPTELRLVKVEESAGSLAATRSMTARAAQFLLFLLTVLLATMLLSNIVEEKSNKVIEVLTASVSVDAIFLGKLVAMLAVSIVGIAVWGLAAAAGFLFSPSAVGGLPAPAVGWPLFVILTLIYYSSNYMLLGALFLSIGSQANSVREVQTLSMPVTIGQMMVFMLALMAVGPFNSLVGIAAAVFPFSSPMAMIARAAQTPELWTHLVAMLWQAFWIWLTLKLGSDLFRRNVIKSGSGSSAPIPRLKKA